MPEIETPADPASSRVGRWWGMAMATLFVVMLGLFAWIWKDLDHRIAIGKEREARTGQPVGPDRLMSPRDHAAARAKAAAGKAPAKPATAP